MSQLRDAYGEFRRQEIEVATVSVDSPYSHRVWARELEVEFSMISDFEHEFMRAYDAMVQPPVPFFAGMSRYHTFIVNADGILTFVNYNEKGVPPTPVEDILGAVQAE